MEDSAPKSGVPGDDGLEDAGTPAPLSPGMIDRTVASAKTRRALAPAMTAPARPWWLRPAAIIPLGLVLLGLVPTYFTASRWSGKGPAEDLTYEEAHHVAFDGNYSVQSRYFAVGRIADSISQAVLAMRKTMVRSPELEKDGAAVFRALVDMMDNPALAKGGSIYARGHFRGIIETLREERSIDGQRKAFVEFLGASRTGIAIIHRACAEPGYLGEKSKFEFPGIKRRLKPAKRKNAP